MGKFTDFKLPLKSLPEGTHEFEYHLDKVFFKNMESEDVHNADLLVKLTVVHKVDIYDLTFNIEGRWANQLSAAAPIWPVIFISSAV